MRSEMLELGLLFFIIVTGCICAFAVVKLSDRYTDKFYRKRRY